MDNQDRLTHRTPWLPWAITSVALVLVAVIAYVIGAQHPVVVDGEPVRHVWVHGGFGGFWLFLLMFWILFGGLRRMWWGWGYPCSPWRYRRFSRYPFEYEDERADWEEWHRRAHGRVDAQGGASDPSTPNRGPIT